MHNEVKDLRTVHRVMYIFK